MTRAADAAPGALSCSVVVPVLDDASELAGLLACLERQSHRPLEVIVVDNGSCDDTAAVARVHGCRVLSEPRRGIGAAASRGYDAARGDLILRCDTDSRPAATWVATHRAAHSGARRGTVAVTGLGTFRLDGDDAAGDGLSGGPGLLAAAGAALGWAYVGAYLLATGAALGHWPLFGTTMSMRRSWWQSVRAGADPSPDVHDDMQLSFLVRPAERVRVTPTVSVGMSPRALVPDAAMRRRGQRAMTTLRRAWADQVPWERWAERLSTTLRHRPPVGADPHSGSGAGIPGR